MNLENRFLAIKAFLIEHKELLNTEVLENYKNLTIPYKDWGQELSSLALTDKIQLENNLFVGHINCSNYKAFLEQINALSSIDDPRFVNGSIQQNLKRKLSKKKQHEIIQINDFLKTKSFSKILDIGSGAGHLSTVLLNNKPNCKSLCIDMAKEYQHIGIAKLKREAPDLLKRIKFVNYKIDKNFNISTFDFDLLLGLHTCGDLAVDLINSYASTDKKSFLGFGCCYHKLSPSSINLSKLAKKTAPLELTGHALTMAAKSYKTLGKAEYHQRSKVKGHRYILHLFMVEELKLNFQTLGNAKKSDYDLPFHDYAKKYLPAANKFTNQQLADFYKENLDKAQGIQNLGIIRSHLARLVELYIILDRALYLQEGGKKVKIRQFFNRNVSPRNLGIWVE